MKKLIIGLIVLCMAFSVQAQDRKGRVSELMGLGKVVEIKKIVVGDLPYTQPRGNPFSVMLVPKSGTITESFKVLRAKTYQGDAVQEVPVTVGNYNVVMLVQIPSHADNTTIFTNYDVYLTFTQDLEGN